MSGKPYPEQPELQTVAPFRASRLTLPANFREALRQAWDDPSKALFGVGQGIPSVFLTKIYASVKPDYIWFDVEHAMFDRLSLHDAIHAAQHHSEGKTMVVVRVPKHDEVILVTALDSGAGAIVIPHSESAQDVKDMVQKAYYPPVGSRSFSPWTFAPGLTDQSLYPNDGFNMRTSNNHIALIAQIESIKGVEMVEEIAACEHTTALMFGPGDFTADAGVPMMTAEGFHPLIVDAMQKIAVASLKYKKPCFGAAFSKDQIPMMIESGYRAIHCDMDVWTVTRFVHESVTTGREYAKQVAKKHGKGQAVEQNCTK